MTSATKTCPGPSVSVTSVNVSGCACAVGTPSAAAAASDRAGRRVDDRRRTRVSIPRARSRRRVDRGPRRRFRRPGAGLQTAAPPRLPTGRGGSGRARLERSRQGVRRSLMRYGRPVRRKLTRVSLSAPTAASPADARPASVHIGTRHPEDHVVLQQALAGRQTIRDDRHHEGAGAKLQVVLLGTVREGGSRCGIAQRQADRFRLDASGVRAAIERCIPGLRSPAGGSGKGGAQHYGSRRQTDGGHP